MLPQADSVSPFSELQLSKICWFMHRVLMKSGLRMQQGRTSETETAVRQLWGKAKVESSMADLKAGSFETVKGDDQDAGWGELFGKRYRKGIGDGLGARIVEFTTVVVVYCCTLVL